MKFAMKYENAPNMPPLLISVPTKLSRVLQEQKFCLAFWCECSPFKHTKIKIMFVLGPVGIEISSREFPNKTSCPQ